MTSRRDIVNSLQMQLQDRGMQEEHYRELVADYAKYWDIGKRLKADIAKRGCKVQKLDSRGQSQIVNNESIDQLLKVSSSMLRILEVLGLSAPKGGAGFGGGDDRL